MIRTILTQMVLPPSLQILLALFGLLVWRFQRVLALVCLGISFGSLVLLSMPKVKEKLYESLEIYPVIKPEQWAEYKGQPGTVIVVLGGGKETKAPEYGKDRLSANALGRVRYGAKVAKATGLPILVSGGSLYLKGISEAELMAEALEEFGIEQVMQDRSSKNTWENAKYTADLLQGQGIQRVILVTQAWHLRRSVYSFEQFGLEVVPAPTMFRAQSPPGMRYVPTAETLYESAAALKEWIGLLAYSVIYETPRNQHQDAQET